MSKDSTQRPRPDSNRGPFDPKSDAVTDRPLRLHTQKKKYGTLHEFALFVTDFQTSVDLLCKKSYKGSSLLGYFDCFQSNHTVGCCNINFSGLSQIRREKICFASNVSIYIFVVLFCATAVVSLQRLANFSPCDPLIFCFSPTRYTHSMLKTIFF